jgi:hypothetical protein
MDWPSILITEVTHPADPQAAKGINQFPKKYITAEEIVEAINR